MTYASRDARCCLSVLIALLLGVAMASPARADDASLAREHYQRGTKFYDIGKYDDAIREFEAAYEAKSDAAIIYNLAQAHRLAGHSQEALQLYRNYLRYVPHPPNRADIDEHIRVLEKAVAERGAAGTSVAGAPPTGSAPPTSGGTVGSSAPASAGQSLGAPPPAAPPPAAPPPGVAPTTNVPYGPDGQPAAGSVPPYPADVAPDGAGGVPQPAQPGFDQGVYEQPPPAPQPHSARRKAGIVIAAVGGAFLVGGAVSGLVARSESKAVERAAANHDMFDPAAERTGRAAEAIQWVGYALGAVGVGLGVVLIATAHPGQEQAPPRVAALPLVGAGLGGALVRMTF